MQPGSGRRVGQGGRPADYAEWRSFPSAALQGRECPGTWGCGVIRVAHFVSTSGLYGAERWVLALLRHMRSAESLLVTPSTDAPDLLETARTQGIRGRYLGERGNYALVDAVRKLSALLVEERIDILHSHGYKSDIIGYLAARKAGTLVLSTPHGWDYEGGHKVWMYEKVDGWLLRRFDHVVPLSDGLARTLRGVAPERLTVINNFVDLESLPVPQQGDPLLISFVGRLVPLKRVQDLIAAIGRVRHPGVRLQVIGDGPMRGELADLALRLGLGDRVQFVGYRDDRLHLLNRSGIFVLPSATEGTPRSLMEAMGLRRVVIGTDIPGIRTLIRHRDTGLLVPVGEPARMAEAIDEALDLGPEATAMAARGGQFIEEAFSARAAAQTYGQLYGRLVKGRG